MQEEPDQGPDIEDTFEDDDVEIGVPVTAERRLKYVNEHFIDGLPSYRALFYCIDPVGPDAALYDTHKNLLLNVEVNLLNNRNARTAQGLQQR
jgi:hypothetical protein